MRTIHRDRAVVVMGKLPVPGRVKTRLGLPPATAAELYAAFLEDVFELVDKAVGAETFRLFACALEADEALASAEALAPSHWGVVRQRGPDLGARMRHAFLQGEAKHVVVLGSDVPTLPSERIREAFGQLEAWWTHPKPTRGAVFVPAPDGGYVLFGLSEDLPALFDGMAWSTDAVMAQTKAAASKSGVQLACLRPHRDIDRVDDLIWLRSEVGRGSHTARALFGLSLSVPRLDRG